MIINIVLFVVRNKTPYSLLFDSLLTVSLVMTYLKWRQDGVVQRALVFLGKHSMNIFLFHTFIFLYYFHDEIYYSENPLVIFLTLLFSCLIISVGMEYVKEIIKYDSFTSWIISKVNR